MNDDGEDTSALDGDDDDDKNGTSERFGRSKSARIMKTAAAVDLALDRVYERIQIDSGNVRESSNLPEVAVQVGRTAPGAEEQPSLTALQFGCTRSSVCLWLPSLPPTYPATQSVSESEPGARLRAARLTCRANRQTFK
jgi:hypothetical protein